MKLFYQMVYDCTKRGVMVSSRTARNAVNTTLLIRSIAFARDLFCAFNFLFAPQRFRVFLYQSYQLVDELWKGHDLACTKVNQPLADAVSLRLPTIFGDEKVVVDPPALVFHGQTPKHSCERLAERRERECSFHARRHIAYTAFYRGKA